MRSKTDGSIRMRVHISPRIRQLMVGGLYIAVTEDGVYIPPYIFILVFFLSFSLSFGLDGTVG